MMPSISSIKTFLRNHYIIIAIFTWPIPIIGTVLLQEPVKYITAKYFTLKAIQLDVISMSNVNFNDINDYTSSEKIEPFSLNQDDPIIKRYWILKFRIRNKGVPIVNSIKLKFDVGRQFSKVIDIKHKISFPQNKDIYTSNTIPNLKWSMDEYMKSENLGVLDFSLPMDENIMGVNVYRSRLNYVGYGRINDNLITNNYYVISGDPSKQLHSYNYAIEAVQWDGQRSGLSDPIPIIESAAFRPFYERVRIIYPNSILPNPRKNVYKSIEEASRNSNDNIIFLVYKNRNDISNVNEYEKYSKSNKVMFLEDIKSLEGKVDINIPAGLDEKAEIFIYLLCKTLPWNEPDINIKMEGNPDIKLMIGNIQKTHHNKDVKNNIPRESSEIQEKKYKLTPRIVTTYFGIRSIYLVWEYKGEVEYKGVRIFRAKYKKYETNNPIGEEIYDGIVNTREFTYRFNNEKWARNKNKYSGPINVIEHNEPPPRTTLKTVDNMESGLVVHAPGRLRVNGDNVIVRKAFPYYKDNNVLPGVLYTYTIFIYDDKNNYSYPITVNTSINEHSISPYCLPIEN